MAATYRTGKLYQLLNWHRRRLVTGCLKVVDQKQIVALLWPCPEPGCCPRHSSMLSKVIRGCILFTTLLLLLGMCASQGIVICLPAVWSHCLRTFCAARTTEHSIPGMQAKAQLGLLQVSCGS